MLERLAALWGFQHLQEMEGLQEQQLEEPVELGLEGLLILQEQLELQEMLLMDAAVAVVEGARSVVPVAVVDQEVMLVGAMLLEEAEQYPGVVGAEEAMRQEPAEPVPMDWSWFITKNMLNEITFVIFIKD